MHYYPHHIVDFDKATRHLTRIERSIYRDLIEMYYDTESQLPLDLNVVCRKILARTGEEVTAVEQALNEFFTKTPTGYYHDRCEDEIEKYKTSNSQKAAAGRASAAARAEKRANALNGSTTAVEQALNGAPTNHEPITINHEPITNNQEKSKDSLPKNKFSDEDMRCAEWLSAKLIECIPDCKKPNITGWAESVRKMRELDNRDHKDICQIWAWCRKDGFESSNVLSPDKLRKRYDQLKSKMRNPHAGSSTQHGQPKPSLIDRFIQNNYGTGQQDDCRPMGGDDRVIRGEVVEPVRGDTGRIGPMAADLIGDFKATGGGGFE